MSEAEVEKRIAKLERRLQQARFATRSAERHLAAIERQTGFENNPKRVRKELTVGLAKLRQCQEKEAELERQLAELRGEEPPPSNEAAAEEGVAAEGVPADAPTAEPGEASADPPQAGDNPDGTE